MNKTLLENLSTEGCQVKIICSWCRQEGKTEFLGEKVPLDDTRETHGICLFHRQEVHNRWRYSLQVADGTEIGIGAGLSPALFRWSGLLNLTKKMRP
jgi:hypothetical protein